MDNKTQNTGIIITLLCLGLLGSCNNSIHTSQELLQWINDPGKGLIKTKAINGFKLTAKYLPPQYLSWQEVKKTPANAQQYDSIFNHYSKFRTFLLTIAPDAEHQQSDIMFYDVVNKVDYKKRVQDLNFNVSAFISLHTGTGELFPVLHTLENTYELAKHKSIYMVYTDNENTQDLLTSEKLDLKFHDQLFDTGISHFIFNKNDLDAIASLDIEFYD